MAEPGLRRTTPYAAIVAEPLFNIVLYQPQIPTNTGNIGRTAMVTGCRLHIVHPIAFSMDEKARRRAGLDYWEAVDCVEHPSWEAFLAGERPARLWLYSTAATEPHWNAQFRRGDYLLFGQENGGVPDAIHAWVGATWGPRHRVALPMLEIPGARSLNLATAVACAVYEGMRQVRTAGGSAD